MEPKGQISPDGRWFWDGQKWLTTSSPDGASKWNGQAWVPAGQVPAKGAIGSDFGFLRKVPGLRSGTRWKVAVAAVAYLGAGWLAGLMILAVIGAAAGLGPSHATPSPVARLVAASPTPVTKNNPPSASSVASAPPARSPSPSPTPPPPASRAPSPVATSPTPRPAPPAPAPPAPSTCGAPANPWGYNFCGGNLIYSPPSSFCSYFSCIPSFWKSTLGYVDECNDGTYSHSGGRQGACSYHGGEMRPLYSP